VKTILVCGGRDFSDREMVFATLDLLNRRRGPFSVLLHGAARGADSFAEQWAERNPGVLVWSFAAAWADLSHPDALIKTRGKYGQQYDARAGLRRNQAMLDQGKPDLVVAFPGGRGTADMVRRAKLAGVKVVEAS
jgi:hypothetical protein